MIQPIQAVVQAIGCVLVLLAYMSGDLLAQKQTASTNTAGATLPTPVSSELSLSITILYFDQSSHVLRPGVKTALDSIARLLVEHPTLMATVTAYTDNVGKRELNMSLSKERAITVEAYLKQRGVFARQIVATWEGPDTKPSADAQTISRRVVVQLFPK